MGVCNCSMFCCTLLYVHSSIAIILMGKRELIALLNLSSSCLVMVERLFLAVPRGCLQFVIVVFPDHTHLLFLRLLIQVYLARLRERMSKPCLVNLISKNTHLVFSLHCNFMSMPLKMLVIIPGTFSTDFHLRNI